MGGQDKEVVSLLVILFIMTVKYFIVYSKNLDY
jgi:hypothetical protein